MPPVPDTDRRRARSFADTSPAAPAAAVAIAGGLLAAYRPVAGAGLVAAGGLAAAGRPRDARGALWAALTLAIGLRVVAFATAEARDARTWAAMARDAESIRVRATVRVDEVRETRPGRWIARGLVIDGPRPHRGAAVRWTGGEGEAPRAGERWSVVARASPDPPRVPAGSRFPPPGLGPGARRGTLEDVRIVERREPRVPLIGSVGAHLRARIDARFDDPVRGLVAALLLGDRDRLDPATTDAFATSGALHLLAVSGLHVGFLAAIALLALEVAGVGRTARAAAVAAMLAGYAALVGGRPSVVRASVMAVLVLGARAGERRVSTWQVWGVAAVAILVWRPAELFGLGFALSFAAVAGLMAAAGPWTRWLEGDAAGRGGVGSGARRLLASGLAATTAASIGTLPVQAAAFGWIAPAGFLLNPVLVPLAGVGLPVAWIALAADAVGAGPVAGPLARAAAGCLALLLALVARGAALGVWVPGGLAWGVGGVAGLAIAAATVRRRPGRAVLAAACGAGLLLAARAPAPRALEVVWLDVGQGDAVVLHFPDGATWLVDAGPANPFWDAGRGVVLPYLRRAGVRSLAWLVTTHADLDHVGGATSVVGGIGVERWGSAGPVAESDAWLSLVAARGPAGVPRTHRLLAGERIRQGTATIDVVHPTPAWVPADRYGARVPENEGSVVLLVQTAGCRLLLTGDLGRPGEERLVEALGDSLRADLLHVGHHGSRHSTTKAFLDRVRPRDAVVSAGRRNRFGHPHPDALARLRDAGVVVHRTDRGGTIRARCDRGGWRVRSEGP